MNENLNLLVVWLWNIFCALGWASAIVLGLYLRRALRLLTLRRRV